MSADPASEVAVLFVCMGNICRSPLAEGVFRERVRAAGVGGRIRVDSAGTHGYHVGHPPDGRARAAAARRGVDIAGLRARAVDASDFSEFDHLLAMDRANLSFLEARCPEGARHKLRLLLDFAPDAGAREVPDPYYGGRAGFERVLDLVEAGADGLIAHLRRTHGR